MDWAAIATGIGAILTAAGGVTLVVREFRRRDRAAYRQEVDDLSDQLHLCRADFTTFRTWAFELRQRAADAGVEQDEPPQPRHLVDEVPHSPFPILTIEEIGQIELVPGEHVVVPPSPNDGSAVSESEDSDG